MLHEEGTIPPLAQIAVGPSENVWDTRGGIGVDPHHRLVDVHFYPGYEL
jgi:hypothetical protein